MKMRLVLFQCLLCSILLAGMIIIKSRTDLRTTPAGTFGNNIRCNDTLRDLCNNLYGELVL